MFVEQNLVAWEEAWIQAALFTCLALVSSVLLSVGLCPPPDILRTYSSSTRNFSSHYWVISYTVCCSKGTVRTVICLRVHSWWPWFTTPNRDRLFSQNINLWMFPRKEREEGIIYLCALRVLQCTCHCKLLQPLFHPFPCKFYAAMTSLILHGCSYQKIFIFIIHFPKTVSFLVIWGCRLFLH